MIDDFHSKDNSIFQKNISDKDFFFKTRDVFEEHLDAINQNTNEIQANYEYLCELDSKLEKVNERLDQIQLFLKKHGFNSVEKPKFDLKPLSKREQEVFLVLYTLDGTKEKITYADIARRTGLTEELVFGYIDSMIKKGVPVIRKHINNRTYLKLNPYFKNLQAKENLLKIEQSTLY